MPKAESWPAQHVTELKEYVLDGLTLDAIYERSKQYGRNKEAIRLKIYHLRKSGQLCDSGMVSNPRWSAEDTALLYDLERRNFDIDEIHRLHFKDKGRSKDAIKLKLQKLKKFPPGEKLNRARRKRRERATSKPVPHIWKANPKLVTHLIHLWEDGTSATLIAEILSTPELHISRGQVIGKANRLQKKGLIKIAKVVKQTKTPKKRVYTKPRVIKPRARPVLRLVPQLSPPPNGIGYNMHELAETGCLWQLPNKLFCGCSKAPRKPYCDFHVAASVTRKDTRRAA